MTTVEKLARAIAIANGDNFDEAFKNKQHWVAERGESGGRYRDVNEPYQHDYIYMAQEALNALLEPSEGMVEASMDADSFGWRKSLPTLPTVEQCHAREFTAAIQHAINEYEGEKG
jgi:hypothetical protein